MKADGEETEFIRAQEVTGNFFAVLGVPAALGRTFATEDDQVGNQRVAVISDSFWQRRFGADPAVVGKTITLEDMPLTIVGVTPPMDAALEMHGCMRWTASIGARVMPLASSVLVTGIADTGRRRHG